MKFKSALLGIAALTVCGCGDETPHKFETGTYAVSSATSTSDQCGLLSSYTQATKEIGIAVSGTTATFNLPNVSTEPSSTLPTATLESNVLTELAEANYTIEWLDSSGNTTCVTRIHKDVVGDVTADNTASLTLSYSASVETGTTCTTTPSVFTVLPCASVVEFTATKK